MEKKFDIKRQWYLALDAWTTTSEWTIQSIAPEGVTCKTCWDTKVCAECLGDYPKQCPICSDTSHEGKCGCQSTVEGEQR